MARRKALEHRPGIMPDIRADGDSVTFHLQTFGVDAEARLIIRCDADGAVWASMDSIVHRTTDEPH
jgi:uncharacterized protein (UPF0548 family)